MSWVFPALAAEHEEDRRKRASRGNPWRKRLQIVTSGGGGGAVRAAFAAGRSLRQRRTPATIEITRSSAPATTQAHVGKLLTKLEAAQARRRVDLPRLHGPAGAALARAAPPSADLSLSIATKSPSSRSSRSSRRSPILSRLAVLMRCTSSTMASARASFVPPGRQRERRCASAPPAAPRSAPPRHPRRARAAPRRRGEGPSARPADPAPTMPSLQPCAPSEPGPGARRIRSSAAVTATA